MIAFSSPPRKKLSLSQNEGPLNTPAPVDVVKSVSPPKTRVASKNQSPTGLHSTTNGITKATVGAKSLSVCNKNFSESSKTRGSLPSSDGDEVMKIKRTERIIPKSKKSVSVDYDTYRVKECEKTTCPSAAPICFSGCSTK